MADEILSIDTDTLDGIADAIRNKGGLPQSSKLSFPDGMVTALQAIETEATVTPKIAPQQVTLTPSNTSFAIDAGFHDGTGTVKIETETGSANPTSTEQTYYPRAGKFFSSFYVGGLGNGTQVVTGTATLNDEEYFVVDNLSFKPTGIIIFFLPSNPSASDYTERMGGIFKVPNTSPQYEGHYYTSNGYTDISGFAFDFRQGRASVDSPAKNWKGTYFYMVMG